MKLSMMSSIEKCKSAMDQLCKGKLVLLDIILNEEAVTVLNKHPLFRKVSSVSIQNVQVNNVSLPNWPNVTSVHITGGSGIWQTLPAWQKITRFECDNVESHLVLHNWTTIRQVQLYNTHIPVLPLWPNIKYIYCTRNDGMTEMPCWPNLAKAFLIENTGLTTLPTWPSLKNITINDNVLLPVWPNIRVLEFMSITATNIPSLPKLKKLILWHCPLITTLPEFPCLTELHCVIAGIVKLPIYLNLNRIRYNASNILQAKYFRAHLVICTVRRYLLQSRVITTLLQRVQHDH